MLITAAACLLLLLRLSSPSSASAAASLENSSSCRRGRPSSSSFTLGVDFSPFYNDEAPTISGQKQFWQLSLQQICYEQFCVAHSAEVRVPAWSAERITAESITAARTKRESTARPPFFVDPHIPFAAASHPADYRCSGWDRGHLTPWADWAERSVMTLANIVPQNRANNRGPWARVEAAVRRWALELPTDDDRGLYVVTGPLFVPDPVGQAIYDQAEAQQEDPPPPAAPISANSPFALSSGSASSLGNELPTTTGPPTPEPTTLIPPHTPLPLVDTSAVPTFIPEKNSAKDASRGESDVESGSSGSSRLRRRLGEAPQMDDFFLLTTAAPEPQEPPSSASFLAAFLREARVAWGRIFGSAGPARDAVAQGDCDPHAPVEFDSPDLDIWLDEIWDSDEDRSFVEFDLDAWTVAPDGSLLAVTGAARMLPNDVQFNASLSCDAANPVVVSYKEGVRMLNRRVGIPNYLWKAVLSPSQMEAQVYVVRNSADSQWTRLSLAEFEQVSGYRPFPGAMDFPRPCKDLTAGWLVQEGWLETPKEQEFAVLKDYSPEVAAANALGRRLKAFFRG